MCIPCAKRRSVRTPQPIGQVRPVSLDVARSRSGGKAAEVLRRRTLWTGRR